MRRTLRTTLLACTSLVALIAALTGLSALWSTRAPAAGLHHLRSRLGASIDAERAALELQRTLRASEVAAGGGDSEPLPGRLDALRDALRSLRARDVARPPIAAPTESTFTDLERYARRATAMANDGHRDEALRLLRDDLSVLVEHRFAQPLAPWLASLDEGGIRSLDLGLSGAAQHWALAPSLGEGTRNAMLARSVEGILVLRLAREAAQEMRNGDGATIASGGTETTWKRLQRVSRGASGARDPNSELARAYAGWRAAQDTVAGEATLD